MSAPQAIPKCSSLVKVQMVAMRLHDRDMCKRCDVEQMVIKVILEGCAVVAFAIELANA